MATRQEILDKLTTVYDPEIAMDIVNLGLVYDIHENRGSVEIKMTLTTPACPLLDQLLSEIEAKVKELPGVDRVKIEIVWDPPWSPDRMSEKAKLALGVI